jgi:hypothetical protein
LFGKPDCHHAIVECTELLEQGPAAMQPVRGFLLRQERGQELNTIA